MRLCPLGRSHIANTFEWVNNYELGRTMDRARPVSEFEHEEWFKRLVTRQDCMYWAIENREGGESTLAMYGCGILILVTGEQR